MRRMSRQETILFNSRFGGLRGSNPGNSFDDFSGEVFRTSAEPYERGYWWVAVLYEDNTGGVAGPYETAGEAREAEDSIWSDVKRVKFSHMWVSPEPGSREAFLREFQRELDREEL